MKKFAKYLSAVVMVLTACFLFGVVAFATDGNISRFTVCPPESPTAGEPGCIDWYKSADGQYYIFLPGSVDKGNVKIYYDSDADVYADGEKVVNGEVTSAFAGKDTVTVTSDERSYIVNMLSGGDIGSVYINTASGTLDHIHADKSNKEPGSILVVDKKGKVQYNGALDSIKGRGNSTWTLDTDKKPYNIKLASKADLFGMGKSKKWCLLANAGEQTSLKNQFAFDLAKNIGVESALELTQINLYINGTYRGLYNITEKVEIASNRVDIYDLEGATEDVNDLDLEEYPLKGAQGSTTFNTIKYVDIPNDPDDITGGYLLELEKLYRYPDEVSGFITKRGQAVVIKSPEYASEAQVRYISSFYQEFEDAFYSPTGYNSLGKHYTEYIDAESLAKMYVLDEFTENFDGCSSSFYLYKDIGGKLTAGPAWDFDLGFACGLPNKLINDVDSVGDPSMLYIKTCYIGNHNKRTMALLANAYMHNDFQTLVSDVWNKKFVPYFEDFMSAAKNYESDIEDAVIMNGIRWCSFGTLNKNDITQKWKNNVNNVYSFINARYAFLDKAFAYDTFYVKYNTGEYGNVIIHDNNFYVGGEKITVPDEPAKTSKNAYFVGWTTDPEGVGKLYDPGDEITVNGNTVLYAQWGSSSKFPNKLVKFIESFYKYIEKVFGLILAVFG